MAINYLKFTAEQANSYIALNSNGSPVALHLEYSKDGTTWSTFQKGAIYYLNNIGDYIMLRATAAGNLQGTAQNYSNYHQFEMNGKISASGSIMTLLDQNDVLRDLTGMNDCFYKLFYNCSALTQAPELTAEIPEENCYYQMFFNCSYMLRAPWIGLKYLKKNSLCGTFFSATRLNYVKVAFPVAQLNTANSSQFLANNNVRPGTFECTSDIQILPGVRSTDTIPSGFNIVFLPSPKMLKFTNTRSTASTFKLTKYGSPVDLNLEYSTDGITWQTFTVGTTYTLANTGDCLYLRAPDGHPNTQGTSQNAWGRHYFEGSGSIRVSGNIMHLYDCKAETTAMTDWGFSQLFSSSSLSYVFNVSDLELPATKLADHCYYEMFLNNGTYIMPALPAMKLEYYCYQGMFRSSEIQQIKGGILPAMELEGSCYQEMFKDCDNLHVAPTLPAVEGAGNCYQDMFSGCTNLTFAPEIGLRSGGDAYGMCNGMFYGCLNLTSIKCNFSSDLFDGSYTSEWLADVSPNGVFEYLDESFDTEIERSSSTVPQGWTLRQAPKCICFTTVDSGFTLRLNSVGNAPQVHLECSTDGETWEEFDGSYDYQDIYPGRLYLRCPLDQTNPQFATSDSIYNFFSIENQGPSDYQTAEVYVTGDLLSLVNDPYDNDPYNYAFSSLFRGVRHLAHAYLTYHVSNQAPQHYFSSMFMNAKDLVFGIVHDLTPQEQDGHRLRQYEFHSTFKGCHSLLMPYLQAAVNGSDQSFHSAYEDCVSLLEGKMLNRTAGVSLYESMYNGCVELKSVDFDGITLMPVSGAIFRDAFKSCIRLKSFKNDFFVTSTVTACYQAMFNQCISLNFSPILPADIAADHAYYQMFSDCMSLTTAPELPATTLANNCYGYMFSGCTALTTAPELPATTLATSCYQYMFSNCTSLTQAPELPATTLADNCYEYMFQSCSALTTASELPATTLAERCYNYMFQNCTALTTAPSELPAITLIQYCYDSMFFGCSALTTPPVIKAETFANGSCSQMFWSTRINELYCAAKNDQLNETNTRNWFTNVSGQTPKTFYYTNYLFDPNIQRSTSTVPVGWNIVRGFPATFTNLYLNDRILKTLFINGKEVPIAPAIVVKSLYDCTGSIVAQRYTGEPVTPDPTIITAVGIPITLQKDVDYVVTGYHNNVERGTATCDVEGIGSYSGKLTISFQIKDVEYALVSSGSNKCSFLTDYHVNDSTAVKCRIWMNDSNGNLFFGETVNDQNDWRLFNYNSSLYWDCGSNRSTTSFGNYKGKWVDVECSNNKLKIDGQQIASGSTVQGIQSEQFRIFGVGGPNVGSEPTCDAKLYELSIYEGETLVKHYTAAESNGVAGLYESVNDEFIAPTVGTGTLVEYTE